MRPTSLLLSLTAAALLAACSPKYDWRDYRSPDAPYAVMFPDKPSSFSRDVDLDGLAVKMTMTAAQVNGTMFAVGSAELPDAALAPKALSAMQSAMVRNIGASAARSQKASVVSAANPDPAVDIEAAGVQNGTPMLLIGHFVSHNKRIYQVIVMGKEKAVVRDQVEMFMSSFKLN